MKTLIYVLALGLLVSAFIADKFFESPPTEAPTEINQDATKKITKVLGQEVLVLPAQNPGTDPIELTDPPGAGASIIVWLQWLWGNVQAFAAIMFLLIAAYEPFARLTPSDKDNNFLRLLQSWLDRIVPNLKKGGGTFNAYKSKEEAPPIGYVQKE